MSCSKRRIKRWTETKVLKSCKRWTTGQGLVYLFFFSAKIKRNANLKLNSTKLMLMGKSLKHSQAGLISSKNATVHKSLVSKVISYQQKLWIGHWTELQRQWERTVQEVNTCHISQKKDLIKNSLFGMLQSFGTWRWWSWPVRVMQNDKNTKELLCYISTQHNWNSPLAFTQLNKLQQRQKDNVMISRPQYILKHQQRSKRCWFSWKQQNKQWPTNDYKKYSKLKAKLCNTSCPFNVCHTTTQKDLKSNPSYVPKIATDPRW